MKIKAAVLYEVNKPMAIEELELLPPKQGEVRVKIAANGVCHSDLHIIEGKSPAPLPIVLGHEASGIVDEVGPGVTSVKEGDHVVLSFTPSCGRCFYCSTGHPNLCETRPSTPGTLLDGTRRLLKGNQEISHFIFVAGFAEYAVVPETGVIKIRDDMPLDQACLVGCGVMTGVGAVINTAKIEPGSNVVVIGTGGVGLNVIQGARLAGAEKIIAVDLLWNKLDYARQFGATHVINSAEEDMIARVRELTGGRGADYAFEVIGNPEVISQAFDAVRRGGTAVVVGVSPAGSRASIDTRSFLAEKKLIGCLYGSTRPKVDMPRLIDLYLSGKLMIDELITRTYRLEEVNEAYEALRRGEVARSIVKFF